MWKSRLKDVFYLGCIGVLCWAVFFRSNEQKFGYIDVKKVFSEFQLKKDLEKKYTDQMSGKKKKIDDMSFELQQMGIELESSSKPDQKKMNDFVTKRKQYMELVKIYDDENSKINSEYDEQIIKQMNIYVKEYGDANNYSMILGSMGNGNIMQAKEVYDITEPVIEFINKKYAGK